MHTRRLANVSVPDSSLITDALEYARTLCEPYLFNHAVRSWLFAARIGQLKNIDCDLEVVASGTLLHDIGLTAGVRLESFRGAFPRLRMKDRFAEACCRVVTARPETSSDNFLRDFGERFIPGYRPTSTVDLLMNAPFEE